MEKPVLDAADRVEEPLFFKLDADGNLHPTTDKEEWRNWMETHGKHLRMLVTSGGALKVGLKFTGKSAGWEKNGNPKVWLAAVLVHGQAITTLSVDSFDAGVKKLLTGLTSVNKEAPFSKKILLTIINLKLRYRSAGWKKKILKKIQG